MRYRKRPILVEAEQWFPPGDHRHKPIEGVRFAYDEWRTSMSTVVRPGDWVVHEYVYTYVVRDRDFADGFEAVEDEK